MVLCRKRAIENTTERLRLMGEILRNIRLIKLNCWEELFMDKVAGGLKKLAFFRYTFL
jgi:hypothetical protein